MDTPEPFENGYALLIGLRYSHWPEQLNGPLKDVKALSHHFSDLSKAAYRSDNIIELTERTQMFSYYAYQTALSDIQCAL